MGADLGMIDHRPVNAAMSARPRALRHTEPRDQLGEAAADDERGVATERGRVDKLVDELHRLARHVA